MCDENKGEDIIALDVARLCGFTDYILLITGLSTTHLRAMSEMASIELKKTGELPLGVEGERSDGWILMDYGDIVIHFFLEETRTHYGLKRLWGDAPLLEWQDAVAASEASVADEASVVDETSDAVEA